MPWLTPAAAPARARCLAEELATSVGANPLWLGAATHDRWTAATSHVPYLAANALAAVTPLEAAPMVGPGFRSTSRLAVSSASMILDILQTNRANVLDGLRDLRARLDLLEGLLAGEQYERLAGALAEGAARRTDLVEASRKERQL